MAGSTEKVIIPRSFVLLEELEKAEKGGGILGVSMGLTQADDISLSSWQCSILGPLGSPVENRIIFLHIHAGPYYPNKPPSVRFTSKVNFPFVVRRRPTTARARARTGAGPAPHASPSRSRPLRASLRPAPRLQNDKTGIIIPNKLDYLRQWGTSCRLQQLLEAVSAELGKSANRKYQQPPEGQEFPPPRDLANW